MHVSEFVEGARVDQVLLIRGADLRTRRDGSQLLRLTLGDRTGAVPGIVTTAVDRAREDCLVGQAVHITGRFTCHERFGAQIDVETVRAATAEEYDPAELLDAPPRSADQMEADLRELVAHDPGPSTSTGCSPHCWAPGHRPGRSTGTPRPPSAITRPTGTGFSSTALAWPRP